MANLSPARRYEQDIVNHPYVPKTTAARASRQRSAKPGTDSGKVAAMPTPPGGDTPAGPSKSAVLAGDSFPAEPTVTAENATNAAKLAGLGYAPAATDSWLVGQSMTVGSYQFHWDGSAWKAGVVPTPALPALTITAGAPGTVTGGPVPFDLTELNAYTPAPTVTPSAAWSVAGDHIVLGDGSKAFWNGLAFAAGMVA